MQLVDLHGSMCPCWPQHLLATTHQCTPLVMQGCSQYACNTCMMVQQGSTSFLGKDKTAVKTGQLSTLKSSPAWCSMLSISAGAGRMLR